MLGTLFRIYFHQIKREGEKEGGEREEKKEKEGERIVVTDVKAFQIHC